MPFTRPVLDENTRIDFYASSDEASVLATSIRNALPKERQGAMYDKDFGNYLPGDNPLVITTPSDLAKVFYAGEERVFIYVEETHHRQTGGLLPTVSLFLCKDSKDAVIRKAYAQKYQRVFTYKTPQDIAKEIVRYIVGEAPKLVTSIGSKSIGMIYMAFGDKVATSIKRSVSTLKRLGHAYPVCVVGDKPVDGFDFIPWKGQSPFDPTQKRNFMFRAGRVKPFVCDMSPFDYTVYLDADTQFMQDIYVGFELLKDYDLALTQEYLTVGELYNKFMAGWEINIEERAQTIKEGILAEERFINSGVLFFRKGEATKKLFKEWNKQWLRFQQWDEQLALMRALSKVTVKKMYLTPAWNDPQAHTDTIILHDYGSGYVRTNV